MNALRAVKTAALLLSDAALTAANVAFLRDHRPELFQPQALADALALVRARLAQTRGACDEISDSMDRLDVPPAAGPPPAPEKAAGYVSEPWRSGA